MGFRQDINALRAVAVVCVVLYHYGIPGFRGGFVGVDVFFVISGFLMTRAIVPGVERGTFSLAGFYRGRARRIIPALLVMNLVLLGAGYFWLLPSEYERLARSVATSATFTSNIEFWREQGYFDTPSQHKLLLHTWSLSVEWQFYMLYPILLAILERIGRGRYLKAVIAVAGALSLGLSVYLTPLKPEACFFLLPTRAWEMLLGALIYLHPKPLRAVPAMPVGLALIAIATAVYDDRLLYPGRYAALPTVGAALVIAGQSQARWLSYRPVQLLGDVSYSLYLIHWPLLVWWRRDGSSLSIETIIALLGVSVIGAYASYRWVESPFRTWRGAWSNSKMLAAYFVVASLVAGLGGVAFALKGVPSRVPAAVAANDDVAQQENPLDACVVKDGLCLIGESRPKKVLFWGDSHTGHLYSALVALAERGLPSDRQLALAVNHACVPVRGLETIRQPSSCGEDNERVFKRALENDVDVVVLASIWTTYFREQLYDAESPPTVCVVKAEECQKFESADAGFAYLEKQLGADLERLTQGGKHVFIVLPVPAQRMHVPHYLAQTLWDGRTPGLELTRAKHLAAQSTLVNILRRVAERTGATVLDPTSVLCPGEICAYERDGVSIYRDNNHLTPVGSRLLIPLLERAVNANQ